MLQEGSQPHDRNPIPAGWWGGYRRADVDSYIDNLIDELQRARTALRGERQARERAEREAAVLRTELEQAHREIDGVHDVNERVVRENEYWRERLRDPDHFMPENVGDMAPLLVELWQVARKAAEAATVRALDWEQRKADEHDTARETWTRMTEEVAAQLAAQRAKVDAELAQRYRDASAEVTTHRQAAQEYNSQVRAQADEYRETVIARARDEVLSWLSVRAQLISSLDELAAEIEAVRKSQNESFPQLTQDSVSVVSDACAQAHRRQSGGE